VTDAIQTNTPYLNVHNVPTPRTQLLTPHASSASEQAISQPYAHRTQRESTLKAVHVKYAVQSNIEQTTVQTINARKDGNIMKITNRLYPLEKEIGM